MLEYCQTCSARLYNFFFKTSITLGGVNATLIALIPKTTNPDHVTHFRPISCCIVIYKTITKILAVRLKPIPMRIISLNQTAFLSHRSITNNILLTHELIKGYNSKYISSRYTMKLDIRKAFDSLNWNFIVAILIQMKFHTSYIAWIYSCISTAKFSILFNGNSLGFFDSSHGVRQGDPVSSYLFIIMMEYFNQQLLQRVHDKSIKLHPKCKMPTIVSLMFADDLIIFSNLT